MGEVVETLGEASKGQHGDGEVAGGGRSCSPPDSFGLPAATRLRDHATVIDIPSEFVARIVAREGDAGREWVDRLPGIVASYLEPWALTSGAPVMHGYAGIVVPVVRAGGEPAVLKVSWVDDGPCCASRQTCGPRSEPG